MDRKSFVPLQLGPGQNYGLTAPDTNENLSVPLEGIAINQSDGPDRTNADIEEFAKNFVGDHSSTVADMIAAVRRQKENAEKPVDGIVVIPAPPRQASGDEMKDSIYKQIVSKLKRMAADAEKETAPAAQPEEERAEVSEEIETPEALSARLKQEQEMQSAQQEAFKEEQRKQRQEEIDKQYGKPEETTRQTGPKRDLSRHKSQTINPGEPGYDELVAATEEILDIKEAMVEALDRHITESEAIFRRTRVLKDAFSLPRELVSEAYKKYDKEGAAAIQALDSILKLSPGLRSVPATGAAGTTSRVKTVKGNLDKLGLEGLMNAVMNPVALEGVLEGLRKQKDTSAEGEARAKELEQIAKENPKQLKEALQLLLDMIKKNAQETLDANLKISKLSVLFSPRAAKMNERIKQVKARAEEYNQSMADIASKHKVSDVELQDAKVRLSKAIAKLDKIMAVSTEIAGLSEGAEKSASLESMVRFAGAWEKLSSGIDEIEFESETALEDLGILDKSGQVVNVFSQAADALSGMEETMGELDPLAAAMASDASQSPAPTDEVMDVTEKAPAPEASESWYEKMMGGISPSQSPAAWAAAAARANIIRNAVKKKNDGKPSLPEELESADVDMPSDEELKKQPVSSVDVAKAQLPREKALMHEKSKEEREDAAAAKPSAQAKKLQKDLTSAAKQVASEIIPKEQLDAFVATHRLARENSKQLNEGVAAGKALISEIEKAVAPEYTAAREKEESDEQKSHRARLLSADADYVNLADKLLSADEKFASALRLSQPEGERRISDSIVTIGNMYKVIMDIEQDAAILSNPDLADQVEDSLALLLRELGKFAKKQKDPAAAVDGVKVLKRYADLASDVTLRFSSRSSKRSAPEVEYVEKSMGPAVEKGLTQVFEEAPEAAAPLATEGPKPELPLGPGEANASASSEIVRTAAEMEAEDESLLADMQSLIDMMPEAAEAYKAVDMYLSAIADFAESVKEPLEVLSSVAGSSSQEAEPEGDWSSVVNDAASWAKDWMGNLMPQQAQPAYATASKSEDTMDKTAGEFDRFDVSKNRLEIVVGEDGKRTLVINKGLKSLVSKRVHDMMSGGYKCGDTVQVDMEDYLGFGTVKSYLGNGVYRVEVDGAVMEVPAKNVLGLESNPWR